MVYKQALKKFYASKGQACVVFERNVLSHHLQLQVKLIVVGSDGRTIVYGLFL